MNLVLNKWLTEGVFWKKIKIKIGSLNSKWEAKIKSAVLESKLEPSGTGSVLILNLVELKSSVLGLQTAHQGEVWVPWLAFGAL